MVTQRVCDCGCGRSLVGRPPKTKFYEAKCRKTVFNRRQNGQVVVLTPSRQENPAGGVLESIRTELEGARRQDSYLGRAAITLAARIDGNPDAIAGIPSMVKELRETMAAALVGTERTGKLLEMRHGRAGGKRNPKTVDTTAS